MRDHGTSIAKRGRPLRDWPAAAAGQAAPARQRPTARGGPCRPAPARPTAPARSARFFALRKEIPAWQVGRLRPALRSRVCFGLLVVRDPGRAASERILPPSKGLPSPRETFASFPSLWFDRDADAQHADTLKRRRAGLRAGRRGRRAARACSAAASRGSTPSSCR